MADCLVANTEILFEFLYLSNVVSPHTSSYLFIPLARLDVYIFTLETSMPLFKLIKLYCRKLKYSPLQVQTLCLEKEGLIELM